MRYIILILIYILCAGFTAEAHENGYIIQADVNDERLVCVPEENVISRKLGIYRVDTKTELDSFCESYKVQSWEENSEAELIDVPNDSGYINRWDTKSMRLERVWDYALDLSSVNVAVIDTGISSGHEDFDYSRITGMYNLCAEALAKKYPENADKFDTSNIEDDVNHGTNVAGIIASTRNNGIGTFGIADGVNLKIYKAYSEECSSSGCIVNALARIYDTNDDVDVINISIGIVKSNILQTIIDKLVTERGIIIVAAAGNDGKKEYKYPASCESVISVGAVGSNLKYASFSQYNDMLDVTAPGVGLYTTGLDNSYRNVNGTSFASPYVTAIAALVKSVDKNINHDGFMKLIKASSVDAGESGYDVHYGWGIIQPLAMLDELSEEYGLEYRDKNGIIADIQNTDTGAVLTLNRGGRDYDLFIQFYNPDGTPKQVEKITVSAGDGTEIVNTEGFDGQTRVFCWDKQMRPMYIN